MLAQKCIPLHNKIECLCSQTLNNMQLTQNIHKAYTTAQAKDQYNSPQLDAEKLPERLQLWYHGKDQIPVISSSTSLMTNLYLKF